MASQTGAVARQYDRFQATLESLGKPQKYLNYGYTLSGRESYEERQRRLCEEVFHAAALEPESRIIDVGFGSGEQDFLLLRTCEFKTLLGFNISERQVRYATARAEAEGVAGRLAFRLGRAEELPGVEPASVDRILAIECAFYFDRPRFYKRAAEVLRPGGLLVAADIALSDRLSPLTRWREDFARVGTRSANQQAWERHFRTRSVTDINRETRPGAQMTVTRIIGSVRGPAVGAEERGEWLKMAYYSQLVALGLLTRLIRYDLVVLEKP